MVQQDLKGSLGWHLICPAYARHIWFSTLHLMVGVGDTQYARHMPGILGGAAGSEGYLGVAPDMPGICRAYQVPVVHTF